MKKKILGDIVYSPPDAVYVLASLIVPHIDIAYANGMQITLFPIGKKRGGKPGEYRNSPPYLEIDAAIAYLTKENAGRDVVYKLAIKQLARRAVEVREAMKAAKP